MSDIRFVVRRCLSEGRVVLPVKAGEKATRFKQWSEPDVRATEADFSEGDNIAERLDSVVDIDCDCDETRAIAPKMLLKTERIHGRPSLGPSHFWFKTDGNIKSEQFKDTDGSVLIEIRTGNSQYTLIPPSIVPTKGDNPQPETLVWECERDPQNVDAVGLRRSVRSVATAALLARHWPSGSRHVAARDAAGFLAARELDPRDIEEIIRTAATLAKDDEVEDRARVARDTAKTFAAGGKTTGGPTLEASIGKDVVATLLKWYGGNAAIHDGVIEEMNKKHFVVRIGKDEVIGSHDDDEGVFFQHEKALHLRYANKTIKIGEKTKGPQKGEPIIETVFSLWKRHPKRRELRRVVFLPPPHVSKPDEYNLWKGFSVQPFQPPEGLNVHTDHVGREQWLNTEVIPHCLRYLTLIHDVICGGEPDRQEEYFEYLMDLLALTVQEPGLPSEVAVVLKGERGTGKGMFIRNFGALFGRHFAHISKPEQIVGKFNASCSAKVVIFADEAFFAGDKRDLGALKVLITEPTLAIERKGIDPIQEPNFVHLFMASNEGWHTPAGFNERRFFALSVSNEHMQDSTYFEAIKDEMSSEQGKRALLTYLLHRPITADRRKALRTAPKTDELRIQQEKTLPPEMTWWKERLYEGSLGSEDTWPGEVQVPLLHAEYLAWCEGMKISRRVSLIDFTREVLKPWLGEEIRLRQDNGSRIRARALPSLAASRQLFDTRAGTLTPWPADASPRETRQPSGEPAETRRAPTKPEDLPF